MAGKFHLNGEAESEKSSQKKRHLKTLWILGINEWESIKKKKKSLPGWGNQVQRLRRERLLFGTWFGPCLEPGGGAVRSWGARGRSWLSEQQQDNEGSNCAPLLFPLLLSLCPTDPPFQELQRPHNTADTESWWFNKWRGPRGDSRCSIIKRIVNPAFGGMFRIWMVKVNW